MIFRLIVSRFGSLEGIEARSPLGLKTCNLILTGSST